jgi:hypothetical protein
MALELDDGAEVVQTPRCRHTRSNI